MFWDVHGLSETRRSSVKRTHKLKLCFSAWRHFDWLDTLLARNLVIEPQEGLVWLHALAAILVHNLERELQHI